MSATKKIALSFLTALFAVSMFTLCAVTSVYANVTANITGVYLTLNENLVLNFQVDNIPENSVMEFTYMNGTYKQSSTTAENNVFKFDKVTPQNLSQTVTAKLYLQDEVLSEQSISVKEYCNRLLNMTAQENGLSAQKYDDMRTLVVDLLYYGSASQKYLASKNNLPAPAEDSLATYSLTEEQMSKRSYFISLDNEQSDLNIGSSNAVYWYGYGLRFDYNVQMYATFAVKDNASGLTVDFNGTNVTSVLDGTAHGYNIYKAYYDLSATSFDKVVTAQVKSGETAIGNPLTYSVKSFVKDYQNDAVVGELAKAVYNYGKSATTYSHTHSFLGTYDFNGTFGSWTTCDSGDSESWAELATVGNSTGNIKDTTNGPFEYVLNEGGDITKISDYTKTNVRVPLSSTSYNLKSSANFDYTYTVNADTAGYAKVIVRMRNTNTITLSATEKANGEFQLNKTLHLYKGSIASENEIAISDSAVLKYTPEFSDGSVFYEYELGVINLSAGDNTIILRFSQAGNDVSGKPKGGYLQYVRLETIDNQSCDQSAHKLTYFAGSEPTCTEVGMSSHMKCGICGKYFTIGDLNEVTYESLITSPALGHNLGNVVTYVDGVNHSVKCLICGEKVNVAHTHKDGEHHLVVAKDPNKTWYIAGETLNADRMEVYTSDICADGCSNIAKIAVGNLTYTYQNGTSFAVGDTYVNISYIDGDKTYVGKVYVTVVATASDMLTIDDTDAVLNKITDGNISRRTNDQGGTGQSAYGGTYISGAKVGDSVSFTFNSSKTSGKLTMQAASNNMVAVSGNGSYPDYADTMMLNKIMDITINGEKILISENAFLKGSVTNLERLSNRWVWTNWTTIDLGNVILNEGENTIVVTFKNEGTYADATCGQIDCFNIYY